MFWISLVQLIEKPITPKGICIVYNMQRTRKKKVGSGFQTKRLI